ncbi:MAG: type II toxin-antitoxin system HicA family toxin [Clostridiales Family XIII bacterium]|nr:type II toxin-antitoxin system HicA family toxin [Clostridiales Family XIII bacterium]
MKTGELLKLFRGHGIVLVKHGGNHDKYYSPITGKTFPVPRNKKEIPIGTLKSILKDAGVEQ